MPRLVLDEPTKPQLVLDEPKKPRLIPDEPIAKKPRLFLER